MGPVSFEAIDVGADRGDALEVAGRLRRAGIRVMSMGPKDRIGRTRWQVVVRGEDAVRARELTSGP